MTVAAPLLQVDRPRQALRAAAIAREQARARAAPPARPPSTASRSRSPRNRTLGIVGESGSGKTTLARCLTRLVEPDERLDRLRRHRRLRRSHGKELQGLRRRIQIVFQDPFTLAEPADDRRRGDRRSRYACTASPTATERRGPGRRAARPGRPLTARSRAGFPRELSGGQRQRVAIARSLAPRPELLIADEAVSALDVSIQAQILNLLVDLTERLGLTMIFISHQLSVIAHVADTVAVMYLGPDRRVGPVEQRLRAPRSTRTPRRCSRRTPSRSRSGGVASRRSGATSRRRSTSPRAAASARAAPSCEDRCAAVDPPPALTWARTIRPAASCSRSQSSGKPRLDAHRCAGRPHLVDDDLAVDDHGPVVEAEAAVAHRDVEVAARVVRPADEVVRVRSRRARCRRRRAAPCRGRGCRWRAPPTSRARRGPSRCARARTRRDRRSRPCTDGPAPPGSRPLRCR